jgi:non-specific serine/threonine protein kinase
VDRLADLAQVAQRAVGPAERAAALAEAQRAAAWGLREAVSLARESGMSWRDLAEMLGVPTSSLLRKYRLGGGLFAASGDAPSPPVRSATAGAPATPGLPLDLFTGRDVVLSDLGVLLRRHRLVTVTGPVGVGKTRLVLEASHELTGSFPGGVFWVPLADLAVFANQALITAAISAAVRAAGDGDQALDRALGAACRAGPVLLVLDNCEHVAAGCGQLAARILAAHPAVTVLAASRETLGVPGEARLRLDPLPAAPTDPGNAWLAAAPAVQLFTDRARLGVHDVALAGHERAIAQICNALDGLPLAIELAAGQCAVLPVTALLALLDRPLDLAAGGRGSLLAPHTSLRAAIGWSYDLLDPAEQAMFRRLSLLPDGVSDLTAAALGDSLGLDPAGVWTVLTSLAGKSLLTTTDAAPRRFGMLAALRDYGRGQLAAAGETAAITEALLAWLAHQAEVLLRDRHLGQNPDVERWATEEMAAFRLATGIARDTGDARYPRLATAAARLMAGEGQIEHARRILEPVLAIAGLSADETVWAKVAMAHICILSSDYPAAKGHAQAAREVASDAGDAVLQVQAIAVLSRAYGNDAARPAGLRGQQAALLRDSGEHGLLPPTLNNLAWDLVVTGQHTEAAAAVTEMLTLLAGGASAGYWHTAGTVALMSDDLELATTRFASGLTACYTTRMLLALAEGVAIVAARDGEPRRALRLLAAAAAHRSETGLAEGAWWSEQISAARTSALGQLGPTGGAAAEAAGATLTLQQLTVDASDAQRDSAQPATPLSTREVTIARLVASGHTIQQIAARLDLSPRTVNNHLAGIRAMLGLANRTELAAWAARHLT